MRMMLIYGFVLFVGVLAPSFLVAQESSSDDDGDFELSYNVGLGLGGFQSSVNYALKDSQGVRYDVMSLLGQAETRQAIGMSDDDFAAIEQQHAEAVSELDALNMNFVVDEKSRFRFKEIFLAAEAEAKRGLTEDQLSILTLMRIKKGVKAVGADYILDPEVAELVGLSEDEAGKAVELGCKIAVALKAKYAEIIRNANRELLESLTKNQQAKAENVLGTKGKEKFLGHVLFKSQKAVANQRNHFRGRMLYFARTKRVQKETSLSQDQIDSIAGLKRKDLESADFPNRFLNDDQIEILARHVVKREFKERGTVEMLAGGHLGQLLELSQDEIGSAFTLGEELRDRLESAREELRLQAINESSELSESQMQVAAKIVSVLSAAP